MRIVLAAVLCLLLAAPARASTAQVVTADSCGSDVACGKYDAGHDVRVVTYVAAPGEANRLTVGRSGDRWTLSDPGATVAAGDGCRSVEPHTAICTSDAGLESIPGFSAQLGDGDDALTVSGGLGVFASLDGGDGADTLTGGDDRDTFVAGPGADRFDGGPGEFDELSFAGQARGATVDLRAGRTSDGDTVAGVERVQGGDGPDRLLGGPGADTLLGGDGNDLVRGRGGDDVVSGERGADVVEGGAGDDEATGDPPQGDNYYTQRFRMRPDIVRGGPGDDRLRDHGGANRLEGGPGDDLVVGGAGRDRLLGGSGDDRLYGHGGADDLRGGAGKDRLVGGKAADRLYGGSGADVLFGGPGRDRARIDGKDRVHACEIVLGPGYTQQR